MASLDTNADELTLRHLANGYTFGLDNHDAERFANVFLPDGKLIIIFTGSNQPPSETAGRDALLKIPAMLSGYTRTMHFLGQSDYQIGADTAHGLVYCLAHHVSDSDHGGLDHVMHMSYDDNSARDADGSWKIADRTGVIHWTETRHTDLPRP